MYSNIDYFDTQLMIVQSRKARESYFKTCDRKNLTSKKVISVFPSLNEKWNRNLKTSNTE